MTVATKSDAEVAPVYVDVRHRRSFRDVRSAFGWLIVLGAGLLFATIAGSTVGGIADDVQDGIGKLPRAVLAVVLVLVQVAYILLLLVTPLVLLVMRRFALLARGALALALAPLAFWLVQLALGLPTSVVQVEDAVDLNTVSWPPTGVLAGCTALAVTTTGSLRRPWRRAVWFLLGLLIVLRVVTSASAPVDVALAIGVGGVVGSAIMIVLGRTAGRLTPHGARVTLEESGLRLADEPQELDALRWQFQGESEDGLVDIRVLEEHGWGTARIDQFYRRLRWRDVGEATVDPDPLRLVTTQSMTLLLAASRDVRVPTVRAVATAPRGESVLAVDAVEGVLLADLDELADDVLAKAWAQVALLHDAGIAHRELDLTRFLLDPSGDVWVTDLDRGQPAATAALLAWDVSALLAATYAVVGADRAVAAAVRALGTEAVTRALPRLVPGSLSTRTRAAVKGAGGVTPLVDEVRRVTGAEEPDFQTVARFKPRTLVAAAFLGIAVYFLAPQFADLPRSIDALGGADPWWAGAVLLASAATYIGAALGLAGGTPGRVPVGEAGSVALASSFVATFSPPGVGQVGLNIRYLQKRGFATPVAVSASAAKETAVFVVHLLLLATFAVIAGSTGALTDELHKLPPIEVVLAILGVVLAVAGIALAIPKVRGLLRSKLVPALSASVDAMRIVVSSPTKLVTLLVGVSLLPLGYVFALYFSVQAMGVASDTTFVAVALVSLTAGAVATAAPTPGGVGVVEAVLLASLTGIGVPSGPALAAVLLYRVGTFWLPIIPGFIAFRVLTKRSTL